MNFGDKAFVAGPEGEPEILPKVPSTGKRCDGRLDGAASMRSSATIGNFCGIAA